MRTMTFEPAAPKKPCHPPCQPYFVLLHASIDQLLFYWCLNCQKVVQILSVMIASVIILLFCLKTPDQLKLKYFISLIMWHLRWNYTILSSVECLNVGIIWNGLTPASVYNIWCPHASMFSHVCQHIPSVPTVALVKIGRWRHSCYADTWTWKVPFGF